MISVCSSKLEGNDFAKRRMKMPMRSGPVRFQSYEKFFEAVADTGKASDDGLTCHWETPFATVETEVHPLSEGVKLKLFEIRPRMDIHIPYEFDDAHFEVTYGISGDFVLEDDYYGCGVFSGNRVSLTQKLHSRGCMIFCRDRAFRGITFDANAETMTAILGEGGGSLWAEATQADNADKRKALYLGIPASREIAASFLQIASCDYPRRARNIFFESKFREILARMIARGLSGGEAPRDVRTFEMEQIKRIPLILMERVDAPPSIPELARELSVNATTMKRAFKNMFGVPIYAYHRDLCLERAAAMLRDTSNTIAEIALESGYSGSISFCGAFKKRYGTPPGRYRRNQK
jgi:AraC-like DNA-binding protein